MDTIGIESVKRASLRGDSHWFDPDTLGWFGSRVASVAYRSADRQRAYFVSSEKDRAHTYSDGTYSRGAWDGRRLYSVRVCDLASGRINTVGEFGQYASRSGADKAARKLAAS